MAKGKGLFGWIVGMATGATLGVLFAPRKGSETRKRIQDAREDGGIGYEPVWDDMQKLGEEMRDGAKKMYNAHELKGLIEEWKAKLQDLGEALASEGETFYDETLVPFQEEAEISLNELKKKGKKAKKTAKKVIKKAKSAGKKAAKKVRKKFKK